MKEAKREAIDPHITWAPDYCKHCFTCIQICPVENLKFDEDEMVSAHKCIQCRLCMYYCPDFALEVKPKPPAVGAKKSAGKKPGLMESGKAAPGKPKTAGRA